MSQKNRTQKLQPKMRNSILVGPFVGELSWEILRFAPYMIYLKKCKPKNNFVVFTRPSRFDLYGQYADILVPLNLSHDNVEDQFCFTIKKLTHINYEILAKSFFEKYKKRFRIVDHIYPDISYFYYKVKWQFQKQYMDYDFKPRKHNMRVVQKYVKDNKTAFINFNFSDEIKVVNRLEKENIFPMFINTITDDFITLNENGTSFIGYVIEILKRCEFVITKFDSYITQLALLLEIPVIIVGEAPSYDSISLINPMKTEVIKCEDLIDGINIFLGENRNENNI